jgi:Ca-activated chloride channel family protein
MSRFPALARFCLTAAVAIAALPAAAAGQAVPPSPETAGLFFRSDVADKLFAAPVLASEVVIDIAGDVARVTVTQRFRNPSQVWLEGIYVYPLPERAAVDRLTMRIGERVIEGRILEREAAQQAYQAALTAGKRASLLSSARPNVFSTHVANIGPGEEIAIVIGYQDQARFNDGEWSYRFPLVVAPRYTPSAELPLVAVPPPEGSTPRPFVREIAHRTDPAATPPARDLFGPVRHPGNDSDRGAINPVSLAVRIDAGVPLAGIASANHEIDIVEEGASAALVTLAAGPVPADRDFVLRWRPVAAAAPQVGLFAERRGAATHLLVSLLPPDAAHWPARPMPRDLVLVIDKSGSMHGASITGARAAVRLALARLQPHDRFNLIVFDDRTARLFDTVVPATRHNLDRAFAVLESLDADGGTEMAGALAAALARQAPEGRLRQVVFLTDGAVSNEASLRDLIETKLGATRLFTVGLGAAPNAHFMRAAAEAGRGSFLFIDRPDEIAATMAALHDKLERPALTDIQVAWDIADGARVTMYPATIPDLYIGDPVTFAARFDRTADMAADAPLRGTLTVAGQLGGKPWRTTVPLDAARAADGVAAIWARAKVASLRGDWPVRQPDHAAMRRAVLETALDYGLVTEFTSLVAIDDTIARPRGETVGIAEIERNLPAGMDFEKIFGAAAFGPAGMAPVPDTLLQDAAFRQAIGLPSTATPATQWLATGAVLLLGGLLLLACTRRLPATQA